MRKRARVMASTLRARTAAEKAAVVAAVRSQVWPLVAGGQVTPVIYRRMPMAEAAEAHRLLASGQHTGKVLLAA
jgi:NADPH:quinone reductase-like Zn-dependent oxidoreductase